MKKGLKTLKYMYKINIYWKAEMIEGIQTIKVQIKIPT